MNILKRLGFISCEIISIKINGEEIKIEKDMFYHFRKKDVKHILEMNGILRFSLNNNIELITFKPKENII